MKNNYTIRLETKYDNSYNTKRITEGDGLTISLSPSVMLIFHTESENSPDMF